MFRPAKLFIFIFLVSAFTQCSLPNLQVRKELLTYEKEASVYTQAPNEKKWSYQNTEQLVIHWVFPKKMIPFKAYQDKEVTLHLDLILKNLKMIHTSTLLSCNRGNFCYILPPEIYQKTHGIASYHIYVTVKKEKIDEVTHYTWVQPIALEE